MKEFGKSYIVRARQMYQTVYRRQRSSRGLWRKVGKMETPIPQPSRISVSSSCETFLTKARSQPTLPAGRTCDGLKADGNYGGGSAAGNPFPDIPRDPTSPEIKVPSYWLKGVVKFTDTAMRRDGARPLRRESSARIDDLYPSFFRPEGETER